MRPAIVHVGVGAFHRAHQAVYLDRLLRQQPDSPWSVCGVGMLPGDAVVRDGLRAQGFAYSVLEKHPDGRVERTVVRAVRDMLLAPEDEDAVVARTADPATRIVSLTITEGGYGVDPPEAVFTLLARALAGRRRDPFTVLSCDNLTGNGGAARAATVAAARQLDPDLASWVEQEVAFPSTMVDRITPVTTDGDRALLRERYGVDEQVPVVCEPYLQWVLEDDFPAGRPELERVGAQFVPDVRPYELMKLRLLNAGHQVLAHPGLLLGHELVHDAARDPDLVALLRGYLEDEGTPALEPVPGIDLAAYRASLLERFGSPAVRDTLERLAVSSADRVATFLVPVVDDAVRAGRPLRHAVTAVSAWLHRAGGDPQALLEQVGLPREARPQVLAALDVWRTTEPRHALRRLVEGLPTDQR